jgi:hypothetical protein
MLDTIVIIIIIIFIIISIILDARACHLCYGVGIMKCSFSVALAFSTFAVHAFVGKLPHRPAARELAFAMPHRPAARELAFAMPHRPANLLNDQGVSTALV